MNFHEGLEPSRRDAVYMLGYARCQCGRIPNYLIFSLFYERIFNVFQTCQSK